MSISASYKFGRPVIRMTAADVSKRLAVAPRDFSAVMLSLDGVVYSVIGCSRTHLHLRAFFPDSFHDSTVRIKDTTVYVLAPQLHFTNSGNDIRTVVHRTVEVVECDKSTLLKSILNNK